MLMISIHVLHTLKEDCVHTHNKHVLYVHTHDTRYDPKLLIKLKYLKRFWAQLLQITAFPQSAVLCC